MPADAATAFDLLRLSTELVEGIQRRVTAQGFDDVRPTHGFAFVVLASGPVSVVELAAGLGVTKQAASQLVEQLVQRGYARRRPDGADARVSRVELTRRGSAVTRVAERSAAEVLSTWRGRIGADDYAHWALAVAQLASPERSSDGTLARRPIRPHG